MLSQPPIWFAVLAFLAALGPLVFIHELGHYWVGRWFGVGAESFSIGFGREIFGWTDRRGTRWKVGWLPLGGYVRFVGDMDPASMGKVDPDLPPEARAVAFHTKPVWQRFLIVLAGPAANFLFAIAIFAAFFAVMGMPSTPNVVGVVQPGSSAAAAGLVPGDRILSVAGREVERFEDISRIVSIRPGETVAIALERDGRPLSVETRLKEVEVRDRFGQSYRIGRLGIGQAGIAMERLPVTQLVPAASAYTLSITRAMIDGLVQIIMGKRDVADLGGPVKMAQIAGQQASLGWFEFIQLVALFSINLGFINLLPVPMLDGGHLLFYTIEAVRRRPLGAAAQDWAFRGGLAFLFTLLLFTTFNDSLSVGLWDRIERLIG